MFKRLVLVLLALLLALPVAPVTAQQPPQWTERRTTYFAILYFGESQADAEFYAGFVDQIYDELAVIFNHRTVTPISLRLYPTLESYYAVNPLARNTPGIVAHADFRRREVVVVLPETRTQTEQQLFNNVRHELAHLVAADLSENRLNVGFQEGVAQYVEQPSRELEQRVALLRQALETGSLLRWSEFDDRDLIYGNPAQSYPQTLSVVAFLVERFGFARLREFLVLSGRSSGYRSALERSYGLPPAELEQAWRDWLPAYVDGGWRRNALTAYDLSYIETLLREGRYEQARSELETAAEWLRTTDQAATLAEAEQLLARSEDGLLAEERAAAARQRLLEADYNAAAELITQARELYTRIGDTRQEAVLQSYAERAIRGQQAIQRLNAAERLAEQLRFPEARAAADAAALEFAALGDQGRLNQAYALQRSLNFYQQLAGFVLLALGLIGIAANLWQRALERNPAEAW